MKININYYSEVKHILIHTITNHQCNNIKSRYIYVMNDEVSGTGEYRQEVPMFVCYCTAVQLLMVNEYNMCYSISRSCVDYL